MRDEARAQKDPIEKRLNILANSTFYGVYTEVIRDDHPKPKALEVYGPTGEPVRCARKAGVLAWRLQYGKLA
jgi:hypothetical protein